MEHLQGRFRTEYGWPKNVIEQCKDYMGCCWEDQRFGIVYDGVETAWVRFREYQDVGIAWGLNRTE